MVNDSRDSIMPDGFWRDGSKYSDSDMETFWELRDGKYHETLFRRMKPKPAAEKNDVKR